MKVYELVKGDTVEILNKKVSDHLNDGWELHGNPFIHELSIFQAMTVDRSKQLQSKMLND